MLNHPFKSLSGTNEAFNKHADDGHFSSYGVLSGSIQKHIFFASFRSYHVNKHIWYQSLPSWYLLSS